MDVLDQDILLNKTVTIKRCLQRIHVEFADDPVNLNEERSEILAIWGGQ